MVSRQPSSPGASHRSRTLTLFAAPASPPEGKKQIQSKTCGFAAGLPSAVFLYKKGNSRVASAAGVPNIHLLFSTTVFLPSTAKSGGLHIVRPPVSAKIQLRKIASYLHELPCIREPLRAARAVPLFRFGEKHPHAYNCAQEEEEREPRYL